ncbi:glycosyltransferase family 4 protein [Microbulbifer variabilis]|uniref:glycosyltransferase family 4 protein n=1 Tax=Microbulbifer variabilis TaxID=266805 RepID=UPI001CFE16E8|nr:glycosyltransferase family 4 protein [Microbulbifer variabilis]
MHILIPVFFKAPLGGLHSHVYAQARAITKVGWRCTILCKPGIFAQQCRDNGLDVIEDNFKDPSGSATCITNAFKFDIVHAHPFASREIGQRIAKILNIPIMLTIHGKYIDSLEEDSDDFSRIFCVSLGVRDHLVKKGVKNLHKILIYPNAVNTEVFYGGYSERLDRVKAISSNFPTRILAKDRMIVFSCRMGPDKEFILNCVIDTWAYQVKNRLTTWNWLVAGDGPERSQLESVAIELNKDLGRQCITFLGWQDEDKLNKIYQSADLIVAPGRSALDGLGSNRPVIAIGSKAYIGIIDEENWYKGTYSNFGGVGDRGYISGELYRDINSIIYDDERLAVLGRLGKQKISYFYDQKYWDKWLVNQYREVFELHNKPLSGETDASKDLREINYQPN